MTLCRSWPTAITKVPHPTSRCEFREGCLLLNFPRRRAGGIDLLIALAAVTALSFFTLLLGF